MMIVMIVMMMTTIRYGIINKFWYDIQRYLFGFGLFVEGRGEEGGYGAVVRMLSFACLLACWLSTDCDGDGATTVINLSSFLGSID